jgi:hypothetical protein
MRSAWRGTPTPSTSPLVPRNDPLRLRSAVMGRALAAFNTLNKGKE